MLIQARNSMTRDARIAGARLQRIAAPLDQELLVEPADGRTRSRLSPAGRICEDVESLFSEGGPLDYPLRAHRAAELADFGVCVSIQRWEPSPGGGSWTPQIEPWPLDATKIDPATGNLIAVYEGGEEPISSGDGRWIMDRASLLYPWLEGAVRPAVEPWLARAFANRDASRFSESAGQNPVIGTLPEQPNEPHDAQFIDDCKGISAGKNGMVKREGYKVERLGSDADQVTIFEKNEARAARDAAIAYLGQDGTAAKGTTGTYGAVKVLDGVRFDLVQRDCKALDGGHHDVIEPYVFYNYGDVRLCPRAYYNVPDPDETARELAEHAQARDDRSAFLKELQSLRALGVTLTPDLVREVAQEYEVEVSDAMAQALAATPVKSDAP